MILKYCPCGRQETASAISAVILLDSVRIKSISFEMLLMAKGTFVWNKGINQIGFTCLWKLLMPLVVMLLRFTTDKLLRWWKFVQRVPGSCLPGLWMIFIIFHGWWPVFRQTTKQATTHKILVACLNNLSRFAWTIYIIFRLALMCKNGFIFLGWRHWEITDLPFQIPQSMHWVFRYACGLSVLLPLPAQVLSGWRTDCLYPPAAVRSLCFSDRIMSNILVFDYKTSTDFITQKWPIGDSNPEHAEIK